MEDKTAFDDTENVIVLQDVDGPLQGLYSVAPGVPSVESPFIARNSFLLQNKSAEQSGNRLFLYKIPLQEPCVVLMISRVNYRVGKMRLPVFFNNNLSTRNKCVCSSRKQLQP